MPLSYSPGLVRDFSRISEDRGLTEKYDQEIDDLRGRGFDDDQIATHLYRKYGFPVDYLERRDRERNLAPS